MTSAPEASGLGDYPVVAPPLPRPWLFEQDWRDLTFLHWPVPPESVAHLFPAGTWPDVHAGSTYVGLVPFRMRDAGFGRHPVRYFGTFAETNVRLYSTDAAGRHGVVFRTLETSRAAMVPFARLFLGVPYAWARMRIAQRDGTIEYRSRRRWPARGLRSRMSVRIGEPVRPSELETWLTARWGAHSRVAGCTIWVPNAHEPWPLHAAEVAELDDDLVEACGVRPDYDRPLRALWSPGVHARFGRPVRVVIPRARG